MTKKKLNDLIKQSQGTVLVDFYADWCAPCQTMDPVIEQVLEAFPGKVELLKVNIEQNREAALSFGVRSIPHYILFRDGRVLWRKGGVMTKRELAKQLKGFF